MQCEGRHDCCWKRARKGTTGKVPILGAICRQWLIGNLRWGGERPGKLPEEGLGLALVGRRGKGVSTEWFHAHKSIFGSMKPRKRNFYGEAQKGGGGGL